MSLEDLFLTLKDFEGHRGRPGKRGGSLPRGGGGSSSTGEFVGGKKTGVKALQKRIEAGNLISITSQRSNGEHNIRILSSENGVRTPNKISVKMQTRPGHGHGWTDHAERTYDNASDAAKAATSFLYD